MKIQLSLGLAGALFLSAGTAHAQFGVNTNNANRGGANGANRTGGIFSLPQGVQRLVSLDAYNTLLAQTQDDDGTLHYQLIPVRHLYSGGIAALFGGVSIPTAQFVSPGAGGGSNGGNGNRGGFGTTTIGGGNNLSGVGGNGFGGGNGLFQTPGGALGLNQTTTTGPGGAQIPVANEPIFAPAF